MTREMIAILDFGSQYGQLIARRVREQNVYSRICPAGIPADELAQMPLMGIILSGGPASVYQPGAPPLRREDIRPRCPHSRDLLRNAARLPTPWRPDRAGKQP